MATPNNPVLDRARKLAEASAKTATEYRDTVATDTAKSATVIDTIKSAIDTGAAADTAKEVATLQLQKGHEDATNIALKAVSNPEYLSSIMSQLAEEQKKLNAASDARNDLMQEEITGITIVDRVINSFRAIPLDADIADSQNEMRAVVGGMQEIAAAQETVGSILNKTKRTVNSEVIRAASDSIAAQAAKEKAAAELEGLKYNSAQFASVMAADAAAQKNFATLYKLQNAEAEDEVKQQQAQANLASTQMRNSLLAKEVTDIPVNSEIKAIQLETAKVNKQLKDVELEDALDPKNKQLKRMTLMQRIFELDFKKEYQEFQQQKLDLEKQRLAFEKETEPMRRDQIRLQYTKAKKEFDTTVAERAQITDSVNKGLAVLQKPPLTEEMAMAFWKSSLPERQRAANALFDLGVNASDVESTNKSLAANPYDAKQIKATLETSGPMPESPATKMLDEIDKMVAAKYEREGVSAPRDEETRKADYNAEAKIYQETAAKEIKHADYSNPYHAPDLESLGLADNPLYNTILKEQGIKEADPQVLLTNAAAAIKSKVLTEKQAVDSLTDIYTRSINYNNTMQYGFKLFGFKNQESYNTEVKRPLGFIEERYKAGAQIFAGPADETAGAYATSIINKIDPVNVKVNMADPTSVRNALLKFYR